MGERGRHSSAELSVVQQSSISAQQRQMPPAEFSAEEKNEWQLIVNRLPADWIQDEMRALLEVYCRHVVSMRHVARLIKDHEQSPDFDLMTYDKLLAMKEREGRAISSLATRLRLTPQSTYDASKKKKSTIKKPWA